MTSLLGLVKKESEGVRNEIIVTTVVSGLANAAVLAIINQAANSSTPKAVSMQHVLLFAISMTLYIMCQRFSTRQMIRVTTEVVQKIRIRLAEKVQRAELPVLEKIGKSRIINAVTQETTIIAESGESMTSGLQAVIFVVFASFYIGYLSRPAFFLTVILAGTAIAIVQRNRALSRQLITKTRAKEVEFLNYVSHAIDGFKEVRLNDRRRDDLQRDLNSTSIDCMELRRETEDLQSHNSMFAQGAVYVLIAAVVFLLPEFVQDYSLVTRQITMAILFIVGPLTLIVSIIPYLAKCNDAAQSVLELEDALDAAPAQQPAADAVVMTPVSRQFKTLTLDEVQYSYKSETNDVFRLGPISLTVQRGEIIFLTGGNGSGKSTLLKVLAGLYTPDSGSIWVDDVAVRTSNLQTYRELFAAVFADFHLFEKLYGLFGTDEHLVTELLGQMHLERKVRFINDRFTTLDLSTGQRKRLALVVSILEDRPIQIFDELAADQDPEFRDFLYRQLLPELKRRGHTIIAATHDDRYFGIADRHIKMEYGKIEFVRPGQIA